MAHIKNHKRHFLFFIFLLRDEQCAAEEDNRYTANGDGIVHGFLQNIAHMPNTIENYQMHFIINQTQGLLIVHLH